MGNLTGWGEGIAAGIGTIGIMLIVPATSWWAWQEYRRRSSAEVRLTGDRIETSLAGTHAVVRLDEIRQLTIKGVRVHRRFAIATGDGSRLRLPPDGFPVFDELAPRLLGSVVPRLSERIRTQVESGEPVVFPVTLWQRGRLAVVVATKLLVGLLLIATLKGVRRGTVCLGDTRVWWSISRLAGQGGLRITDTEVARLHDGMSVRWGDARIARLDEAGIVLVDDSDTEFTLPASQPNFWPLTDYLQRRLGPTSV